VSAEAQVDLAGSFAVLMAIGASALIAWILWSLGWDLYDHFLQERTRRRNARFDARVGRDVYRDVKGVQR
jgi:hypothetical protein